MKKSQRNAKRRSRNIRKCPVEIGNEYEVEISGTTPLGVGMARINGFLVLINNTNPGDHVRVEITKTDPINAEAEVIKNIP